MEETRQGALSVCPLSDSSKSSCGTGKQLKHSKRNEITPILNQLMAGAKHSLLPQVNQLHPIG